MELQQCAHPAAGAGPICMRRRRRTAVRAACGMLLGVGVGRLEKNRAEFMARGRGVTWSGWGQTKAGMRQKSGHTIGYWVSKHRAAVREQPRSGGRSADARADTGHRDAVTA